jgi:hypothetical protein
MYESLIDEGFNISYSSVVNAVNSIERSVEFIRRKSFLRENIFN